MVNIKFRNPLVNPILAPTRTFVVKTDCMATKATRRAMRSVKQACRFLGSPIVAAYEKAARFHRINLALGPIIDAVRPLNDSDPEQLATWENVGCMAEQVMQDNPEIRPVVDAINGICDRLAKLREEQPQIVTADVAAAVEAVVKPAPVKIPKKAIAKEMATARKGKKGNWATVPSFGDLQAASA